MKKRVSGGRLGSLFILVIILVAVSLVIDLAFLNVLYGLQKSGDGLRGELASSLTEKDCDDIVKEAFEETYQEVLDDCLAEAVILLPNIYLSGAYYVYFPPGAEDTCEKKADQAGQKVARNARSACMALLSESDEDDYFKY